MMDDKVFTQKLLESEGMLYRVAASLLPGEADRMDAMQETALKAWQNRQTLREEAHFSAWITRILMNECRNVYRRQKRLVLMDAVPETSVQERDPQLRQMLEALPRRHREVLVLFYLEGFSIQEIAGILHIPQGTVKYRLHAARKAMKVELSGEEAGR